MNEEFNEELRKLKKSYLKLFIVTQTLYGAFYFFINDGDKDCYRLNANIDVKKMGEIISSYEEELGWKPKIDVTKEAVMKSDWFKNENGEYQREVISYDLSEASDDLISQIADKTDLDDFEFTSSTEVKPTLRASDIEDLRVIEIRKYDQDFSISEYKKTMISVNKIVLFLEAIYGMILLVSWKRDKAQIIKRIK